jgi:hypothetical protein
MELERGWNRYQSLTPRNRLSDLDDLSFGVPGLDGLAGLLARESAGKGRGMRNGAMRGIGLILPDDTEGLLAPVTA